MNAIPALRGLAFGPLVPVDPDPREPRTVGADLDERRPEVRIEDVEVVRADPPLLPEEIQARDPRLLRSVPGAPDPLELLGHDHRDHPEAALTLRRLEVRADVIELAIIPPRAVRRCQPEHRDLAIAREPPGLGSEPITDPPQQRRRRDRMTEMTTQEPHDLTGHLQPRDVRVQQQPIDTLDLERHMTLEHVVDVRHARHPRSNDATRPVPQRGRPGGGLTPSR